MTDIINTSNKGKQELLSPLAKYTGKKRRADSLMQITQSYFKKQTKAYNSKDLSTIVNGCFNYSLVRESYKRIIANEVGKMIYKGEGYSLLLYIISNSNDYIQPFVKQIKEYIQKYKKFVNEGRAMIKSDLPPIDFTELNFSYEDIKKQFTDRIKQNKEEIHCLEKELQDNKEKEELVEQINSLEKEMIELTSNELPINKK